MKRRSALAHVNQGSAAGFLLLALAFASQSAAPLCISAQTATAPAGSRPSSPEADKQVRTLRVAADGSGQFRTVQQAVDAAPSDGALILVAPGTYREAVSIPKPNIELRGTGSDPSQTVIVDDKNAGENGGTLHSATVEASGDGFRAENITLQNDFNRTHPQLPAGSQALALMLTADRSVLRNVHLLGNQDTVYAGSKHCAAADQPTAVAANSCPVSRSYFVDCLIAGNVDFIFGDGDVVFDHCEIRSTTHAAGGYITAQSRNSPTQDSAYVFNHCKLTAEPGVQHIWLGRPWRPYAKVIFMNTGMGAHIEPAGWREWHPGETHSLDTVYYAEYNSTGPGAHPNERDPHTKKLTSAEAARYETKTFLAGSDHWDPTTVR